MRFLMVDRLENSPSTFRQGECHHHRHSKWGSEYREKSRFRLSPFRRAGFQPSLHRECVSGPAVSARGIGQRLSGRCRNRSGHQRQPQLDRIEE